jgi:hypothetical protein
MSSRSILPYLTSSSRDSTYGNPCESEDVRHVPHLRYIILDGEKIRETENGLEWQIHAVIHDVFHVVRYPFVTSSCQDNDGMYRAKYTMDTDKGYSREEVLSFLDKHKVDAVAWMASVGHLEKRVDIVSSWLGDSGEVESAMWIENNGYMMDYRTVSVRAAIRGHLDMIVWLKSIDRLSIPKRMTGVDRIVDDWMAVHDEEWEHRYMTGVDSCLHPSVRSLRRFTDVAEYV